MAATLGTIMGAVIFGYLWSRLWLWLSRKLGKLADPWRIYVAYGIAWVTATGLGAAGFADGGQWNWGKALIIYTPALALWLAVDLLAFNGKKREAAEPQ